MSKSTWVVLITGFICVGITTHNGTTAAIQTGPTPAQAPETVPAPNSPQATQLIGQYCLQCHNDRALRGNLSLVDFDATHPSEAAETAEKIIRKLTAGMMIIVPQGCWHRFESETGVRVMTVTPQPTDHTAADDPNETACHPSQGT